MSLTKLFEPKSIAIIGASNDSSKVGNNIFSNLVDSGFRGKIYPINNHSDTILGVKAYKSVLDITHPIDLVIICVPAVIAVKVMKQIGIKGIPFAIIISAGFRETGSEGLYFETELMNIAREYNVKVLGPNCLGLINANYNLNASFSSIFPKKGNIAFISQSGALCTSILSLSLDKNFGFSKFISVGNKIDLDESDLIEYLGKDDNTELIIIYLESLSNVEKFTEAVKKTITKKPIVMIKSGVTKAGSAAIASHTGSMAGDNNLYSALFKQLGIIRVDTLAELFDAAEIFSKYTTLEKNNVSILTNGGGIGVITADKCELHGIPLTDLSLSTINKLRGVLPKHAQVRNPIDVIGDADNKRFEDSLNILGKDNDVGIIFLILTPQSMTEVVKTAETASNFTGKPIIASFVGNENRIKIAHNILDESKIPSFEFPEMGVNALKMLISYQNSKSQNNFAKLSEKPIDEVDSIFGKVRSENRNLLSMEEGFKILDLHGIKQNSIFTRDYDECKEFFDKNKAIVLKVDDYSVSHKTEKGFVSKKLTTIESLKSEFERLKSLSNCNILCQGFSDGAELIIGGLNHKKFGELISVGFGGIFTEILKDISFGKAPSSKEYLEEMVNSLKLSKSLKGFRGLPKKDIEFLIDFLDKIQEILISYPDIKEIEINPLILKTKSGDPVDIVIRIND